MAVNASSAEGQLQENGQRETRRQIAGERTINQFPA
jgi:hypothetical protein